MLSSGVLRVAVSFCDFYARGTGTWGVDLVHHIPENVNRFLNVSTGVFERVELLLQRGDAMKKEGDVGFIFCRNDSGSSFDFLIQETLVNSNLLKLCLQVTAMEAIFTSIHPKKFKSDLKRHRMKALPQAVLTTMITKMLIRVPKFRTESKAVR